EVLHRMPHALELRVAAQVRQGLFCQMAIDQQVARDTRSHEQFMGSDEARVRFDDFQPTIAMVALELHVADPLETNTLEEFLAQPGHFRKPFTDVVARATPIHRKASDDALGEVKEAVSRGIDKGSVARRQAVRARY